MIQHSREIEVFYDGGCPLCRREIEMIRRRDQSHKIRFTDIDVDDFEPQGVGKTQEQLMAEMHVRLADGSWAVGIEAFRRLYAAIGFRKLVALSRLPGISQLMDLAYSVFAKYRLPLTGRCESTQCQLPVKRADS